MIANRKLTSSLLSDNLLYAYTIFQHQTSIPFFGYIQYVIQRIAFDLDTVLMLAWPSRMSYPQRGPSRSLEVDSDARDSVGRSGHALMCTESNGIHVKVIVSSESGDNRGDAASSENCT